MNKSVLSFSILIVAAIFLVGRPAEARPQYLKRFTEMYEKVADQAKEHKCGVCHGNEGKNKKVLSDYGKVLQEALGGPEEGKNIKDEEKIDAALNVAAEKDSGNGTTYGALLEEGKLPPPAPAEEK